MRSEKRRIECVVLAGVCAWAGLATVRAAEGPRTQAAFEAVNPKVGTAIYSGALYPGAALPFSMVKLSPDTTKPSTAGYNPDEPILGFSHTHIGGTGGAAFAGQIRVRPQSGELNVTPAPSAKADEVASPGYYAVTLTAEKVRAELTLTPRAGYHRYTFDGDGAGRVLIDVSATINNLTGARAAGKCVGSAARFISDSEVEGETTVVAGYANMKYTVYFVGVFDRATGQRGVWVDGKAQPGVLEMKAGESQSTGVYAEFGAGAPVGLRVGISYTSLELARKNLEEGNGLTFDEVRARAKARWMEQLSKIVVEGGTEAQRRQFYTAMYHTVLAPIDVTGDNAKWTADDKQSVYWDIYCLWDTFRTTNPLLTLIEPDRQRGIIRHLLAVYEKTGWLPDAWVFNKMGIGFQGGTHADNVIADAVVKKLGGFDVELAYAAIRKNATDSVPNVSKIFPMTGRLPPYLKLGYVPSSVYIGKDETGKENVWSAGVSRTLEYSYNDFAISQVAEALGKTDDAELFRRQSLNAYTLFDPARKLFWGKKDDGSWMPDGDAKLLKWGWTGAFYEGNAWQYRFSMPHDIQGLIDRLGGDAAFLAVLDEYFDTGMHYAGNEPGFLTPWLHVYAGRPDKTVDRVRAVLAKSFKMTADGYPGDEDVGAMSAYYIFSAMGFYPNAGQDVYLLGSPVFTKVTMKLGETGKTLVISAPGVSDENQYVQSATLNGKPWDKAWFRHGDIAGGAELVLTMGPKPSAWGTKVRPPSLSVRP